MSKATPLPRSSRQLEREARDPAQPNPFIQAILNDPLGFIFDSRQVSTGFSASELDQAYEFFCATDASRYVYSVCSALFHRRYPKLESQLFQMRMSDFPQSRFWPFWKATDLSRNETRIQDRVEDYLLDLWSRKSPEHPSMYHQTGHLIVTDRASLSDEVFIFKVALPIYQHGDKKPSSLTFAFDSHTRGFYSLNARIKFEDPEFRFRYLEFIKPHQTPPTVTKFLLDSKRKQWKVLVVLDRHIGDNLSLFSTHIRYLAQIEAFDLTIDTSLCPLFNDSARDFVLPLLPSSCSVNISGRLPVARSDYDIVFDPYDWATGVFDLKPQNDSTAISFVSGLELARCYLNNIPRDILDIHMASLKRFGVVNPEEPKPGFVQFNLSESKRAALRQQARYRIFGEETHRPQRVVTLFPFGLTDERRYPTDPLQMVVRNLLKDPQVQIIIAGAERDTEEAVQALRSDWPGVVQPCQNRIKVYLNERLPELMGLMLASDALVCMDSGPLHLARALRLNPIALYTKKVNDARYLISFPWMVKDGTADVLKPIGKDEQVQPDVINEAIQKRLKSQHGCH